MCGESNRQVLGGTIAILKAFDNLPDISLLFHHDSSSTTASFQSEGASSSSSDLESCQIVIHRDGDLRSQSPNQSILHAFSVPHSSSLKPGLEAFALPKRLDLGVGDEGVVGRRVSLVRNTALGSMVLRQGIIGWN